MSAPRPRGLRLFGEPVHPPLVHLPLAAMVAAPLWDALGVFHGDPLWWGVAFWTLVLGVAVAALAATAGFVDYAALPQGHPAVPTATRHLLAMLTGVSLAVVRLVLQGGPAAPEGGGALLLVVSAAGALVVAGGGFLGGRLVYRHGIGVDGGPPPRASSR